MAGCLARPVSLGLALINIYRKRGSLKQPSVLTKKALSLTLLLGHIRHKCSWSGDGERQCHRQVAENVAEARQGAQKFSQISLACPSNRRRAVDVVVDKWIKS
jgi:hypothetical protein